MALDYLKNGVAAGITGGGVPSTSGITDDVGTIIGEKLGLGFNCDSPKLCGQLVNDAQLMIESKLPPDGVYVRQIRIAWADKSGGHGTSERGVHGTSERDGHGTSERGVHEVNGHEWQACWILTNPRGVELGGVYGPSHVSQDGEYVMNFINAETTARMLKTMGPIRDWLKSLFEQQKIEVNIYPDGGGEYHWSEYVAMSCVFNQSALRAVTRENTNIQPELLQFAHTFGMGPAVVSKVTKPPAFRCGVKFRPLSSLEMLYVDDIRYDAWREIFINKVASDLVANRICSCFPLFVGYSFTEAERWIYSSDRMVKRFVHSDRAKQILKTIDEIQRMGKDIDIPDVANGALEIIHERKIMSGVNLLMSTSLRGVASADIKVRFKSFNEIYPGLITPESVAESLIATLVRFSYGLAALHDKGIIHRDIHRNNVVVKPHKTPAPDGNTIYQRQYNKKWIAFPYGSLAMTIIDFSRALISDTAFESCAFKPPVMHREMRRTFYRQQAEDLPKLLARYLGAFVNDNLHDIRKVCISNWNAAFEATAPTDIISAVHCVKMVAEDLDIHNSKLQSMIDGLIRGCTKVCRQKWVALVEGGGGTAGRAHLQTEHDVIDAVFAQLQVELPQTEEERKAVRIYTSPYTFGPDWSFYNPLRYPPIFRHDVLRACFPKQSDIPTDDAMRAIKHSSDELHEIQELRRSEINLAENNMSTWLPDYGFVP